MIVEAVPLRAKPGNHLRTGDTGVHRVTICGQIAGLAYEDHDVVGFLRRAGLPNAEQLLDRPEWVEWRGGRAHTYVAA
ncbi:hypothetical protein ACFWXZ_04885 [[Kitasatospora] papulosa]|uniref:hypothetical protein n=1 Tax=Streptomyces TaxID=1883 RepID=UPI0033B46E7B